jgi:hypothetical protein
MYNSAITSRYTAAGAGEAGCTATRRRELTQGQPNASQYLLISFLFEPAWGAGFFTPFLQGTVYCSVRIPIGLGRNKNERCAKEGFPAVH